jgi:hypothetical protein
MRNKLMAKANTDTITSSVTPTPAQIRQIKTLLGAIGLTVSKSKSATVRKDWAYYSRRYGRKPIYPYRWTGVQDYRKGPCCPSNHPADIQAHYSNPAWFYVRWLPATIKQPLLTHIRHTDLQTRIDALGGAK